ncbi:MAG: ion transporter [Fibrobacterales bacterium]
MMKSKMNESFNSGVLGVISQLLIVLFLVEFTFETMHELYEYSVFLHHANTFFTGLFLIEYILRIWSSPKPIRYIFSIMGLIDFLSILPGLLTGADLKGLRIIRIIRIGKLLRNNKLKQASDRLFLVFQSIRNELVLFSVFALVFIYISSVGIYYFEHIAQPEGFGSIPKCFWWAIVTLTTVGYGDFYPITIGGKIFTALVTLIGIAIVAIPSGLIASGLIETKGKE